jgi:hypothetical protein
VGAIRRGGIYHPASCNCIKTTSVGPIVGVVDIGHTYGYCRRTNPCGGLNVGLVGNVGMDMGHPRGHYHPLLMAMSTLHR